VTEDLRCRLIFTPLAVQGHGGQARVGLLLATATNQVERHLRQAGHLAARAAAHGGADDKGAEAPQRVGVVRPELVEPREFVIVEGLLPLTTRMSRACFDVSVYLDPPEPLRHEWKIARDTGERGYERDQVEAELARREPESVEFIRPQRAHADIVVRFAPIDVREDPPGTPLSAELILRPTVGHPDLTDILSNTDRYTMHLKLLRDDDGRPVDALHVHGYVEPAETEVLAKSLWTAMGGSSEVPDGLGRLGADGHSEPLAITQLLLLHHLVAAGR